MNEENVKIFVVSGKANSGKDTTCSMIKNHATLKGYKCINLQFSYYIKMYAKTLSDWNGSEDNKPRLFLQTLGTDIRKKIDKYFFIKRIIEDIKVYSNYCNVITISDARFPEEIDTIYDTFKNVIRIHIKRPNYDNNLNANERKHATEVSLDEYDNYDYVLVNDDTIEKLDKKINKIVKEVL